MNTNSVDVGLKNFFARGQNQNLWNRNPWMYNGGNKLFHAQQCPHSSRHCRYGSCAKLQN